MLCNSYRFPLAILLAALAAAPAFAQTRYDMPGMVERALPNPNAGQVWSMQGMRVCPMSGTTLIPDAKSCGVFTATLTAGGSDVSPGTTLKNPVGLMPFKNIVQDLRFKLTEGGSGSNFLGYGSAFNWTSGVHPILTTRVGGVDWIYCNTDPEVADTLWCSPGLLDLKGGGPVPVPLVSNGAVNGSGGSSIQVALTGYSGHPIIVGMFWCDGGSCTANTVTVTSISATGGNSCAAVSNTLATGIYATQIWVCGPGAVGTNTLTANCSAGSLGCNYLTMLPNEFSTITGNCEAGNHNQGTAQNFNAATGAATSRTNEVIYSISNRNTGVATPTQTALNVAGNSADSYQIGTNPASYTNSFTSASSQQYVESVAACY